jgi:hypothetical protein
MSGPTETKVAAATTAAAVATALSNLALCALETYAFHGDAVPSAVSGAVQTLVIAGATFAAGWYARHTPRPDLTAVADAPGEHARDGDPGEISVRLLRESAERGDGRAADR